MDLSEESIQRLIDEVSLEAIELPPGEKAVLSLQLPGQFVIVFEPVTHSAHFFDVQGEPTRERQQFSIVFNHPVIEKTSQSVTVDFAKTSYLKEIARARTFGFMHDVERLREDGLALGGGLDNALVLDEYRLLNAEGLRFADEFIRHKVLDAIGDLYLLGRPMLGAFTAHKSGHALNNRLLRELVADASSWEMATFERAEEAPAGVAGLVRQPA